MQPFGIIGTCLLAAVGYGVVHDLITHLVCAEFFTADRGSGTPAPVASASVWSVLGLLLGMPLALAARAGSRPKRSLRTLVRPVLFLLALMAGFALVSGVIGYVLASTGTLVLPESLKEKLPAQKWATFQACAFAHQMSYNVGFVGGGMTIAWVWVSRKRLRPVTPRP